MPFQPIRLSSPAQAKTIALRIAASAMLLVPLVVTGACSIQADKKNGDGEPDHVKISTPLGGLNVKSSNVDAASLGLPEYPGAHILTKDEDHGNDGQVDLHMGFGPWQMRIKVVSYGTSDPQDKVMTFYRTALAKYGDVVECSDNKAVGSPTVTKEGLGCDEHDGAAKAKWNENGVVIDDRDVELKAGSKRRQHIVGFKKLDGGETKFALISLDLPGNTNEEQTN